MSDPMLQVPAEEAQRDFGHYQDKALTQPVAVTRRGRPPVVMISAQEYERLRRRDRQVFRTEEAPEELIKAVLAAEPPAANRRFDEEVR